MREAETWDRLSARYDRVVGLFDRSYPRVRELLRSDLAGREHVLEVAAGTGQFTFDLAQIAERVTATDVSPEMVKRLEAKLRGQGVENVETAVMSAYELEVPDQSLDGIFCANALHVMESPLKALVEFKRALRRGGRLVVPTFCHGVDWRRRVLSALLSVVSPFVAHTKFSPDSLRELVASAGFEPAEPVVLPGRFPMTYLVADSLGSQGA
jgi:ubiquinone/menaquinone biosynthesis C-methylase UbiE